MAEKFPHAVCSLLALLLISCVTTRHDETAPSGTLTHQLKIVHPGDPDAKPMPHELVQVNDVNGEPQAYWMWVDSVICREKFCEVVRVQLHWDALGNYTRYDVAIGSTLTKLDHVPFTDFDHAKLHSILVDKQSSLRVVDKDAMTGKPSKKSAAVDGVVGATILTLKDAVVIGAGYCCYDLWHWANGEVASIVRGLSAEESSAPKLFEYLASGDDDAVSFAMDALSERKIYSKAAIQAVVATLKSGSDTLMDSGMAYLKVACPTAERYCEALKTIFADGSSKQRSLIIEALGAESLQPPAGFLDALSVYLPKLESHHEVHLFLTLMEKRNAGSQVTAKHAAKLLSNEKFFIARRAFWYLEKQTLEGDVKTQVDAFLKKHEDRL
jgi:hypothetical protein